MKHVLSLAGLALVLSLTNGAALADSDPAGHDHDVAREALSSGAIRPLTDALAKVSESHPGQVLEVELEREHGGYVYEIKILGAKGGVFEVEVNAQTLEILKVEGQD